MIIKNIYVYQGENGTIQTPVKLPMPETKQMRRLIADAGKELINGDEKTTCIDVEIDEIEKWTEVDVQAEQ